MSFANVTASGAPGFARIRFLTDELVAEMQAVFDGIGVAEDHPWYQSRLDRANDNGRRSDQLAQSILRGRLAELFPYHRPLFVSFVTKGAGSPEPVRFHHDPMFSDERVARSYLLWCPLVDCDDSNAVLKVVPGSHLWTERIRPTHGDSRPGTTEPYQDALAGMAVGELMRAGDGLLMDAALIHGSGPNWSEQVRSAFVVAITPPEAPILNFYLDDDDRLTGHIVDESFFLEHDLSTKPVGYPSYEPWTDAERQDDIDRALGAAGATCGADHPVD